MHFPLLALSLSPATAVRNNLWDWQSLSPSSGGGTFFEFCDALEVKNGVSAGPKGWGLQHALQAWGSFWTKTYYPDCELSFLACQVMVSDDGGVQCAAMPMSCTLPYNLLLAPCIDTLP